MDENWEVKLAKELPKVELHLHLDGSISPGIFIYYLSMRRYNYDLQKSLQRFIILVFIFE